MNLKKFLKIFVPFILIVSVLAIFTACGEKEDDLSKLFDEGELGDFWSLEDDDAEIVIPDKPGEEDFIDEDEVLNMDAVKRLANGGDPFAFMNKFPVPEIEPGLYYLMLPNDYALRIEHSEDVISKMYLEDNLLGESLDLQEEALFIDDFLRERGDDVEEETGEPDPDETGGFFTEEEDDAEIVAPPKPGEDDFTDDDTLNMDAVKRLAYGGDPFAFMNKFPAPDTEPGLYYLQLPNDYAIRIEYSGDAIDLMYLEDNILGESLNLQEDALFIDDFLNKRAESGNATGE